MNRPSNLPREELLRRAQEAIDQFEAQGTPAYVNFTFTCENCGQRCTLVDRNMLHAEGECHRCFHMTRITEGGFTLTMNLASKHER